MSETTGAIEFVQARMAELSEENPHPQNAAIQSILESWSETERWNDLGRAEGDGGEIVKLPALPPVPQAIAMAWYDHPEFDPAWTVGGTVSP